MNSVTFLHSLSLVSLIKAFPVHAETPNMDMYKIYVPVAFWDYVWSASENNLNSQTILWVIYGFKFEFNNSFSVILRQWLVMTWHTMLTFTGLSLQDIKKIQSHQLHYHDPSWLYNLNLSAKQGAVSATIFKWLGMEPKTVRISQCSVDKAVRACTWYILFFF